MPIEEVGMAKIGSFFLVGCNPFSCFVFWVLCVCVLFIYLFIVIDAYRRGGYG